MSSSSPTSSGTGYLRDEPPLREPACFHCVPQVDALPPFFINLASASDLWMFLASNGGLTAGRVDAEGALFPYQSVDRIYDGVGRVGPVSAVAVPGTGRPLWEPFADGRRRSGIERNLYKSFEGDRVWFEEVNHGLGLRFRYGWATAGDHGFVREVELANIGAEGRVLRVLDGLRNVQPPGIPRPVQDTSSCLADAYKTAERVPDTTLAVFSLSAGIIDRAVPLEVLKAAAVWSHGLPEARILLSEVQLQAWFDGAPTAAEERCRGRRTHYLLDAAFVLPPGERRRWMLVADSPLSQVEVVRRSAGLREGCVAEVLTDVARTTQRLRHYVGRADGMQRSAAGNTAAHHFANVLYNVMRGGVLADEGRVDGKAFAANLQEHSRAAASRNPELTASLGNSVAREELMRQLGGARDPDLQRLAREYLPLTFSRRHGDPSRPWNRFRIRVRDDEGRRLLAYEGNWRDIFQNWEALGLSYPDYFDAFVAKFLNASTVDGYNPYRITHAGVDWEAPNPEDPWSTIGYWGDHQAVYLQKLLEWAGRFGRSDLWRTALERRYATAAVPYRIRPFAEMRRDPRTTIDFDTARHREILAGERSEGTDARLLREADGGVRHVTLVEKLLILVLARMSSFVPGGGVWMNTQRPEWNDANNALVGYGVSVVTLAYLRRMAAHLRPRLAEALRGVPATVSGSVAQWLRRVSAVLAARRGLLEAPTVSEGDAGGLLAALAEAGDAYRAEAYRGEFGGWEEVAPAEIDALLELTLQYADHTLRANRRDDGLYHAYNLLEFIERPDGLRLHRLPPMLEGQVAVLSAGLLAPDEALDVLRALRASPLYRADQHSYLLYPDRELPGFLERNVLPPGAVEGCALLASLAASGDRRLVERDGDGRWRFQAGIVNRAELDRRLDELAAEPGWATSVTADAAQVRELHERVFRHHAFTGRSGTMFGYEGLGSIYWHMVAKLLLAVQENALAAAESGATEAAGLAEAYHDVRAGLGFNKTPAEFGAFPTDPYSHTPGHAGAQQPGMTGQVKEEILTRWGELGVCVEEGRLALRPRLLKAAEFLSEPDTYTWVRADGEEELLPLPRGSVAFTCCGTPVVYWLSKGAPEIRIHRAEGLRVRPGCELDATESAAIFARTGEIRRIEVALGVDYRPLP